MPCHASRRAARRRSCAASGGSTAIVASDYMGVEHARDRSPTDADLGEAAAALALVAGRRRRAAANAWRTGRRSRRRSSRRARGRALLDAAVTRVLAHEVPRSGCSTTRTSTCPPDGVFKHLAAEESRRRRPLAERSHRAARERRHPARSRPDSAGSRSSGPIADSARDLLGDYSHLVHIETLQGDACGRRCVRRRRRRRRSSSRGRARRATDDPRRAADRGRGADGVTTPVARACVEGTDEELAEAVAPARDADVAIVVLGERSGLTDDSTTGEFRDRVDLGFLGRQQELLEARGRDRYAGRPRGRQRPAARAGMGGGALRRDPARVGARATPGRTRSPTSSPAR